MEQPFTAMLNVAVLINTVVNAIVLCVIMMIAIW